MSNESDRQLAICIQLSVVNREFEQVIRDNRVLITAAGHLFENVAGSYSGDQSAGMRFPGYSRR